MKSEKVLGIRPEMIYTSHWTTLSLQHGSGLGTRIEQIGKTLMGMAKDKSDTLMGSRFLGSEAKTEYPSIDKWYKSDN